MSEPVLVIHGVANRDPDAFNALVADLKGRVGSTWELIPVFWGDAGAGIDGIADTIPGPTAGTTDRALSQPDLAAYAQLINHDGTRALTDPAQVIADAAVATIATDRGIPAAPDARPESTSLQATIHDELPRTAYLRFIDSEPVLTAVGESIGRGLARNRDVAPEVETSRGFGGSLIQDLLHDADQLAGAVLGEAFGGLNRYLRTALVPNIAQAVGDVFVYEHLRQEIQNRIWQAIDARAPGCGTPDRPIHVVAHSLGGVIAFQAATSTAGRQLCIDGFVTFGSQAPFFHVLDPAGSVMGRYEPGHPVEIPSSIRSWTNLWEPLDPVAFIAGKVFRIGSPPQPPRDVATQHLASSGLWTHSSYWASTDLVDAIRTTLAGVPVSGGPAR
jgi:pimeloyl-ACP methyl ester carboxylesterase